MSICTHPTKVNTHITNDFLSIDGSMDHNQLKSDVAHLDDKRIERSPDEGSFEGTKNLDESEGPTKT